MAAAELTAEENAEMCLWGLQLMGFTCRWACAMTSCLGLETECMELE
jgi:hypothetical protein